MSQEPLGTLYGIGIGPGDPELITLKGLRVLQRVRTVFVPIAREGAKSFAAATIRPHLDLERQRVVELLFAMRGERPAQVQRWRENARLIARELLVGRDAAFVTEGDPTLYSTFMHVSSALAAELPGAPIRVVPGVSSVNAAAAAAGVPLADGEERIAILPALYDDGALQDTLRQFDTVVLLKVAGRFDRVLDALAALGDSHAAVLVSRCGCADERVVRDVEQLRGQRLDYFSTLVVRRVR
ncbi:MAG TPA: precorrin-2 C(20)-methyltransferase [Chloroflexota bacterium]|nr:precorrin-2 C(20)-methyltransferase [Chloroflexota bacterium]